MKKYSVVILMILLVCLTGCGSKSNRYVNKEFLSENTNEVKYETKERNISWGNNQAEMSEISESSVILSAGGVVGTTKEELENNVKAFKKKLDFIDVPYALGYSGNEASYVDIKIDASKIGLPVLALLNVSNETDRAVVSQMGDMTITKLTDFTYTQNANGGYDFSVKIPESEINKLNDFCKQHIGEGLYLKIGALPFSKCVITDDTTAENLVFENMIFLGKNTKQTDYEKIAKLAEYVMNTDSKDLYPMSFNLDADKLDGEVLQYGIPYITEMDEQVLENASQIMPGIKFERRGVKNNITLWFDRNSTDELSVYKYLEKVEQIYTACDFDGGAYSSVGFSWPSEESDTISKNNFVIFTKKDGKMICKPSDKIADIVKGTSFFYKYMQ